METKNETFCDNSTCANTKNLQHCSKCNMVQYCSKKCQIIDWKDHKVNCLKIINKKLDNDNAMKVFEINKSDIDYLVDIIFKTAFNDILTTISYAERHKAAFVYEKCIGYGYFITNNDKEWVDIVPNILVETIQEKHVCMTQRILCVLMQGVKGRGVGSIICDCFK
jgi:hypothetical protein